MIWWVLFLFITGMVLILAEFIVPGGLCGVIGVILLITSTIMGCSNYPDHSLWIIIGEIIGAMISIALGMIILSKTRAGKAIILDGNQPAEEGWVASESDESLLDAIGEVHTALRPAGTVLINKKRIDAVADGSFIERDIKVRVIEVSGNRVVVEKVDVGEEEPEDGFKLV